MSPTTGSGNTRSATATQDPGARLDSAAAQLLRTGFTGGRSAVKLLSDRALAPLARRAGDLDEIITALGATADPDRALLALVRLLERTQDRELLAVLAEPSPVRARLLAVLGGSVVLGEHLVRHPEHWRAVRTDPLVPPVDDDVDGIGDDDDADRAGDRAAVRALLLRAVGADPAAAVPVATVSGDVGRDALRVAYRQRLLAIAAADLASSAPLLAVDAVTRSLSDLADAALETALALARAVVDGSLGCRFAVIAMGKCGARELNYVSDVDVVYVVAPNLDVPGADEATAIAVGTKLASELALACSATTAEGVLWPVDPNLRPEGRDGPLVRTLESHLQYYRRWAKTWEFQALLKARPAAGDHGLGIAYAAATADLVWRAADRPDLVPGAQAMRRRVEEHVPARERDRQLKLGRGGLRDVEFSVQLLQLVHGRTDPALRTSNTLDALQRLAAYGYVGRHDAAELDHDYRFLRVLEHRLQLKAVQRTHLLPTAEADLRRLGRAAGIPGGVEGLQRELAVVRRRVRRLHEALFYRPLLAAVAALKPDEVRLSPAAAQARLGALGYRDPAGALRHIAALSSGVSRRAAIQRQLLPVMLGWFAEGAGPDEGLLSFRRISEKLGGSHWYLKMLRDEGAAAQRVAVATSSSRLVADGLERDGEAVRWLGDDTELAPRSRSALRAEVTRATARQDDLADAAALVRRLRGREMLRTALADVLGLVDAPTVREALSTSTGAVLDAALEVAWRAPTVMAAGGGERLTRFAVVGMGRLGGAEMGYGSDADVVFVHDPLPGVRGADAQDQALALASELTRILTAPGPEPALEVDARLRPEGRNGPLARSLGSCREYYRRWSEPWEAQALLRAVPTAGDLAVGRAFCSLVDPLRHPDGGADEAVLREVRRVKARVEGERLPRGIDPRRHLKLGPGGLADVEWTAQLLQLRHSGELPSLRTPSTTGALRAAAEAGLVDAGDVDVLVGAWEFASRLRDALVLHSGRPTDVLPREARDLDAAARLMGYPVGSATAVEDDLRRWGRRARTVVERVFYG
ncbi:glutamate-ammonia-ligase adenylyltransferase [Quadrisphaera granulorum]|uniref:Bifunctional glutamine synthetase adenylyltransferase/adenylyl-removing enzyme n=1 Tax=Quadrisphaera granulorum TaxID=317664 RepID=A0A316A8J3_9ACTN|nr:bifunctional [glutamine synthetase] adenylyltransferase/[glutamine synthetase]-adenylyl-L-tyrosine phosphorylase [Quadrisphaera granulorum]PWJ53832.1 glutamate-ammonia-ligase adenylyltransferase [Quadrisphaera granulorum]SZE96589.1 glutamate-ammonia-ligase adenylyltransferase [Quadrisphaera granulorum]